MGKQVAVSVKPTDEKGKGLSTGALLALMLGIGVVLVAVVVGYKVSHPLEEVKLGELQLH